MSNSKARETIESLCQILCEANFYKLKPENFRLAKFDDDPIMNWWNLLYDVLSLCNGQIPTTHTAKHREFLCKDKGLVDYVKDELRRHGVLTPGITSLTSDMSSGSRELLLAFSVLLYKEALIEKLMAYYLQQADDYYTVFAGCNEDGGRTSPITSVEPSTESLLKIKEISYHKQKLDFRIRQLYSLQRLQSKLEHKIALSTTGIKSVDRGHLTMSEVEMIFDPKALDQKVAMLTKQNRVLNSLLTWKKNEECFWQWMESVLEQKIKGEPTQVLLKSESVIDNHVIAAMNDAHRKLHTEIVAHESLAETLDDLYTRKVSSLPNFDSASIIQSVSNKISETQAQLLKEPRNFNNSISLAGLYQPQFRFLLSHKTSSKLCSELHDVDLSAGNKDRSNSVGNTMKQTSNPRNHRKFSLQEKTDLLSNESTTLAEIHKKAHSSSYPELTDKLSPSLSCHIDVEIDRLKNLVHSLENKITLKQQDYTQEMHDLTTDMPGIVCIPPVNTTFSAS